MATYSGNNTIAFQNRSPLVNVSNAGNFDSGIVTLIQAPTVGYLKFKAINTVAAPVAPTVTFTVNVPGTNKETEMQIYFCGILVFNQAPSGLNTVTFTLDLSPYADFVLANGQTIQYRMRGAGALAGSQTITYPSGLLQVLAWTNTP